ncbi:IS3 family transposase [Metamycoplasma equirhinis]|uniref:IS3 family transposase n=1 Tax=Metamycoplasma equirhinis TaxID=92402 RepID=UPI0035933111
MNHVRNAKFPENFILHSDHGYQYSSSEYTNFIKMNNGKISMSRVGNSLDNREAEYFFSILKSEIFPNFYTNVKKLTFAKLKTELDNFINWCNNKRFNSILNWKTSQEVWEAYKF